MTHVRVLDTPEALAAALADTFVRYANEAVDARGHFDVALSGGTTPKAAYALLAQAPRRSQIPWNAVRVFFGDERCVPPADADSNYRMASQAFLDAAGVAPENVHRMRGEDDPRQAALDYADLLVTLLGESPRFDLVLLGMGPDGHTASLFPGLDPRTDQEQLVRAVWVQKMQTHRLTLTPAVINAARHVVIAAEGAAKAAMLQTVLTQAPDFIAHPVQCIAPAGGTLEWLVDRAAYAAIE